MNSFIKSSFLTILLLFSFPVFAKEELILKDNLKLAKVGDYLVTAQNKNYTILLITNKTDEELSIEEITLSQSRKTGNLSWKEWVKNQAPGHNSWIMYTINLPTGIMQKIFSFTKNDWINLPESQNFFSTLLNLKLNKVDDCERKKIGTPPSGDSRDRRKIWQPPLIVDGTVITGVLFDAWQTRWPSDNSDLSGKVIEVFVPKENDKYPSYFPYWLQISGIIGNAKVRIVDSGNGLISPKK